MAITTQFLTGFEHGFVGSAAAVAGGGLTGGTTTPGSGWSASTSSPRNGNYCARLVAPANTSTSMAFPVTGNPTTLVLRFGIKFVSALPAAGTSQRVLIVNNSTPATVLTVTRISDGDVQISYAGQIGSIFTLITDTDWHLFEFQLDATAKTLAYKLDGVTQTPLTASGTTVNFASVLLGTNSTSSPTFTADYDDLIFGTWTVAGTDWYGDGKVLAQRAGSDGTHVSVAAFSPGEAGTLYSSSATDTYTMVDDAPGTSGWTATRSTTDNLANRSGGTTQYLEHKPATTAETGQANAVRAIMSYSSPATQGNLYACDVRNSAGAVTELWGLTGGVGKAYNIVANQFKGAIVTTPAAGWTAAEVNAIRVRFGGCTSTDINPIPTLQAWMIEVDWPISAGTAWTDTPDDAISIADVITPLLSLGVLLADTMSIAHSPSPLVTYERAIPETLTVADVLAPVRSVDAPLADTLTVADLAAQVTGKDVALADLITMTDSGAGAIEYRHGFAWIKGEELVLTDASLRDLAKVLADGLTMADQATPASGLDRSVADTIGIADVATPLAIVERILADTLGVADQQALVTQTLRTLADTLGVADLASVVSAYSRAPADTLAVTDQTTTAAAAARALADTLALIDQVSALVIVARTLADTLSVSDQQALLRESMLAFSDPLGIADARALTSATAVSVADLLSIADFDARLQTVARAFADTLSIVDLISASGGGLQTRTLADTLTVADSLDRLTSSERSFADTLTVADALTQRSDYAPAIAELLVIADVLDRTHDAQREFTETLSITDIALVVRITAILMRLRIHHGSPETAVLTDTLLTRVLLSDLARAELTIRARAARRGRLADRAVTRLETLP